MKNRKKIIGLSLALVSFALLMCLPAPNGLPLKGMHCIAVFSAVFFLYLFESINAAIVSLLIVPLLVVLHVTDIQAALSGFSSTSTYLIVGSFVMAEAVIHSKLGNRITYLILLKIGTSVRAISFGIMLVNIVLAFMIPSSTGRTALMLPICLNIIKQFTGSDKRSRFGANLLMTLCVTNSTISAGILTSTISNPMAAEYISKHSSSVVGYTDWLIWGLPPALLMTVISWLLIQIMFKTEKQHLEGGKDYIQKELSELGPICRDEKISLAVFVGTILLWIFGENVGIDSATACLLGACVLCLPKIGVLKWKDCKDSISLSVVFICSGGISLGAAMSSTGAASWMAKNLLNLFKLNTLSIGLLIIALIIIVQFMHVMFVGTATMANVFFPILIGISAVAGINCEKIILPVAMIIGGYPVLMFFNTTPSILCYDTGHVTARDFPKLGVVISIIACIVYAGCTLWYWPLTGLL